MLATGVGQRLPVSLVVVPAGTDEPGGPCGSSVPPPVQASGQPIVPRSRAPDSTVLYAAPRVRTMWSVIILRRTRPVRTQYQWSVYDSVRSTESEHVLPTVKSEHLSSRGRSWEKAQCSAGRRGPTRSDRWDLVSEGTGCGTTEMRNDVRDGLLEMTWLTCTIHSRGPRSLESKLDFSASFWWAFCLFTPETICWLWTTRTLPAFDSTSVLDSVFLLRFGFWVADPCTWRQICVTSCVRW